VPHNTRVSHSLLGSRKVRIVLSVPVHLEGSNQAAKAHVHKVCNISEETTAARQKSNNHSVAILQGNRQGFLSKEGPVFQDSDNSVDSHTEELQFP